MRYTQAACVMQERYMYFLLSRNNTESGVATILVSN